MNKILVSLYNRVPIALKKFISKMAWLKKIKDLILKKNGHYREVSTVIKKSYENYNVEFEFFASIQNVAKASKKGIESTVLKNAIKLIDPNLKHKSDAVVFDIGANFGFLSLVWARSICKNSGHVFAFEPNAYVYKSVLKAIHKNELSNTITLENKAIGSENKTIDVYLNNTTSNVIKNKNIKEIIKVDMITLDAYVEQNKIIKCDLIKIDVDGIELDILEGSVNTLLQFKPIFIVETNNDNRIIEFFLKYHYKVLNMKLEGYVWGSELPLNIFCVPNGMKK